MDSSLRPGDCYDLEFNDYCRFPSDTCYVYAYSSTNVANCQNKPANYLHLRYSCVPGT